MHATEADWTTSKFGYINTTKLFNNLPGGVWGPGTHASPCAWPSLAPIANALCRRTCRHSFAHLAIFTTRLVNETRTSLVHRQDLCSVSLGCCHNPVVNTMCSRQQAKMRHCSHTRTVAPGFRSLIGTLCETVKTCLCRTLMPIRCSSRHRRHEPCKGGSW